MTLLNLFCPYKKGAVEMTAFNNPSINQKIFSSCTFCLISGSDAAPDPKPVSA
jgi:hypothetical protein